MVAPMFFQARTSLGLVKLIICFLTLSKLSVRSTESEVVSAILRFLLILLRDQKGFRILKYRYLLNFSLITLKL